MGRVVLVVPCYNEESRLQVSQYLRFLGQSEASAVSFLFVNDGSKDGTLGRLRELEADATKLVGGGRVSVLDLQPNGGKAEAVRRGMNAVLRDTTLGPNDVVGFWDGDLATPLAAVLDLLGVFRGGEDGVDRVRGDPEAEETLPPVDMVFGARVGLLGRDVKRKLSRHYLGRIFATLASVLLGVPIYDTQCGAKLFRPTSQLRQALADPFRTGWIFDVELLARLARAYDALGFGLADAVFEYPLHRWQDLPGSKLGFRAKVGALWGLFSIWRDYFSPWAMAWPSPGAVSAQATGEL